MRALWITFVLLQALGAGHINYQQEAGYYEINPIYGRHPSKERVYLTKGLEIAGVYGLTKLCPQHKKKILATASSVVVSFMVHDKCQGINLEFRF